MRMYDVISKKRDGKTLTKEEIDFFIKEYTGGNVPDYQAAALLMAIFLKSMDSRETVDLTHAVMRSGDIVDLSAIEGIKVDKHSTGGVGDTTTLVLGPIVAACGVPVAKMSGRGLGHTGGTLDKLESIEGFKIEMSPEAFIDHVNRHKIAIVGQTANIAPADKKLYALRDVTATVDNVSLIAASVMSKKLAAGSDAIVLDVKCGSGAFIKTKEEAIGLSKIMVDIGTHMGRQTMAVVTDMSQPLGYAIGNALEVKEAIDTLEGRGPEDLTKLCLVLGTYMVALGTEKEEKLARKELEDKWRAGKGLELFKTLVKAQGGNESWIENPIRLPQARHQVEIPALSGGYVSSMRSDEIGICAMMLGAGRAKKEDAIDMSAGIVLKKKLGNWVEKGETLAVFHTNKEGALEEIQNRFYKSILLSENPVTPPPMIQAIVTKQGVLEPPQWI